MDGVPTPKAGSGGKALPPVPSGAGAATCSARVARKATLPAAAAGGAADAPAAATAVRPGGESNGGGGGEEEEEDEQVERFYALLDNIRAIRGAYRSGSGHSPGADDGVVDTVGGVARVVKRLRGSEPPWRPAFRLEDFEEPAPASSSSEVAPCAKRTRGQEAEAEADARPGAGERVQPSPR